MDKEVPLGYEHFLRHNQFQMLQTIEFKFYKQVSNPILNVHAIRSYLKYLSPQIQYRTNIQSNPIAIKLDSIKNIDN